GAGGSAGGPRPPRARGGPAGGRVHGTAGRWANRAICASRLLVHAGWPPTMARMQGSSVHGATRNRLSEPEDDWLGEVSDYDWSENAAAHAEAGRVRASPESD